MRAVLPIPFITDELYMSKSENTQALVHINDTIMHYGFHTSVVAAGKPPQVRPATPSQCMEMPKDLRRLPCKKILTKCAGFSRLQQECLKHDNSGP